MKYNRLRLLLLLCLVIAALLPMLSSYGWQGAAQVPQDEQQLRKQAAVARKKLVQQLVIEQRDKLSPARPHAGAQAAPDQGNCALPYPSIGINQMQTGQLTTGDCTTFVGDGTFADIYSFNGTAGQQVAISLGSTSFDAYLYLCDVNGTVITQDDDGGGGTNAQIPANKGFFTLPLGTSGPYQIVVNALLVGQTGNYELSVYNGLQFYPLPVPVRLLDTRPGASPHACSQPNAPIVGQTSRTQPGRGICTIPSNAQALVGNVTSRQSGGAFLTFYPSDAPLPLVATINFNPNEVMNNVFTVGLGFDGAFNIFAWSTTDVVVDVTGYYAPPGTGGLYFHPLPTPVRLLETRENASPNACFQPNGALQAGSIRVQGGSNLCGIPATARVLVGNATTVIPSVVAPTEGFLTLYPYTSPTLPPPEVTSSTYNTGDTMNAQFVVKLTPGFNPLYGFFNIYTSSTTELVVDVLGYYSAEAADANGQGLLFSPLPSPVRLLETRPGQPVGCDLPQAPLLAGPSNVRKQKGGDTCTIPGTAKGLIGNATVVYPVQVGYLTFYPSTTANGTEANAPLVATSNYVTGQILNRHFTVGLGASATDMTLDKAFKIYTHQNTHLVIDVSGYFAPKEQ